MPRTHARTLVLSLVLPLAGAAAASPDGAADRAPAASPETGVDAAIVAPTPAPRPAADAAAAGGAPFDVVARVLLSPRCRNCHPAGDAPLQYDEGRPHVMEVGRAAEALGLACSACHGTTPPELSGLGMPPGAPNWHLPPKETPMVFEGRTPAELCAQLKDPAQTGGKDLAALLHHVEEDALVLWGWSPGEGRTTPPVSHAAFVEGFRAWVEAGGPCP